MARLNTAGSVKSCVAMFRYQLVDESWTHIGEFESDVPEWSVGQEFATGEEGDFAIVAIVPNLDEHRPYEATWVVESA
ncbi:MAG: hypothetical protein QOH95_1557 [Gaiellaceae bacterium]|nr:hypothetical protein [Gaiellaceae bacterium]